MRLGLAGDSVSQRASALVLGSPTVATILQSRLEGLGFQTKQESQLGFRIPHPAESDALDRLRQSLKRYVDGSSGSPGEHLLHPGVSPWAERSELITISHDLGLAVVAPSAKVVSLFGNRLALLEEATRLGIPHLAVSLEPVHSVREIEARLGTSAKRFPFVLKSVRGGGGVGIFVVHSQDDLEKRLPLWLDQVARSVGEVILIMERYVEDAIRIVVPFARLKDGTFKTFPKVDATLMYQFRKLVQFCPAIGIGDELEQRLDQWTQSLAQSSGYIGVGSVEFFIHGEQCYLLEGVPRLNTDFQLWESVSGTSALDWQMLAVEGRTGPIPSSRKDESWEHAVSLRLCAEDPVFKLPQPGVIHELSPKREWKFPKSEAFLLIPYSEGDRVGPESDGVVGQLLVGAQDRKQALTNAGTVLDELWIAGGLQLNDHYLAEVVRHPWVQAGMFHSGFLEEEFIPEVRPRGEHMILMATLANYAMNTSHNMDKVSPLGTRWAVGDQWVRPTSQPIPWARPPHLFERDGLKGLSGILNGKKADQTIRVCLFPLAQGRWRIRLGNWILGVRWVQPRSGAGSRSLFSQVSGRVHAVLFREGTVVPAHEAAIVVESMHRLIPHSFPTDVRITNWKVEAEDRVMSGQVLAEVENLGQT